MGKVEGLRQRREKEEHGHGQGMKGPGRWVWESGTCICGYNSRGCWCRNQASLSLRSSSDFFKPPAAVIRMHLISSAHGNESSPRNLKPPNLLVRGSHVGYDAYLRTGNFWPLTPFPCQK